MELEALYRKHRGAPAARSGPPRCRIEQAIRHAGGLGLLRPFAFLAVSLLFFLLRAAGVEPTIFGLRHRMKSVRLLVKSPREGRSLFVGFATPCHAAFF